MALHRALEAGLRVSSLFTMVSPEGYSMSHRIPRGLLALQAEALGLPLLEGTADWGTYEEEFKRALVGLRATGIRGCIFGDIDLEDHLSWCRRVCRETGLEAVHPLWGEDQGVLLDELLQLGYRAVIVVVDLERLGPDWLGRDLDAKAVDELLRLGISPCGETGEYHTLVVDGPVFRREVPLGPRRVLRRGHHAFLDLAREGDGT